MEQANTQMTDLLCGDKPLRLIFEENGPTLQELLLAYCRELVQDEDLLHQDSSFFIP